MSPTSLKELLFHWEDWKFPIREIVRQIEIGRQRVRSLSSQLSGLSEKQEVAADIKASYRHFLKKLKWVVFVINTNSNQCRDPICCFSFAVLLLFTDLLLCATCFANHSVHTLSHFIPRTIPGGTFYFSCFKGKEVKFPRSSDVKKLGKYYHVNKYQKLNLDLDLYVRNIL